jgi:hypothetical protein
LSPGNDPFHHRAASDPRGVGHSRSIASNAAHQKQNRCSAADRMSATFVIRPVDLDSDRARLRSGRPPGQLGLLFSWRLGGARSSSNEPARVPNGSSDGARAEDVCGADARLPRVLRRSRSPSSRHTAPTAPPCLAKSPDPTTFAPAWPYCDTRRRAFETRSIDS